MTDDVNDMQALTLVESEVVGDIILDRDDEAHDVLDRVGECELVTETVVQGLEEEDTDAKSEAVDDMQALTLAEPEAVDEIISELDEEVLIVLE